MKKLLPVLIILFSFLFIFNLSVKAMGVRPLVIDLEMIPGETKEFEIILIPSDEDEIVNLGFYKPVQLNTGALSYQKASSESYSVIEWVKLEKNRVDLLTEENRVVRGMVTAPFSADGTHTVVVMVEPEVEEAAQGVTFKVRYAIRLNIIISRPGMRPSGELLNFKFLQENTDSPVININFHNNSKMYYETMAEATIRNEQGRLVQRIEMKPPAAWQSGSEVITIYPDAEVLFTGNITEPLYPGNYQLRLFFRYANGMQIIERRELQIEEGIGTSQELKPVKVLPDQINLEIRPGAANSQVIELENLSDEEVYIAVSGRDIEADYVYSIYRHMDVQLRGEQEMVIAPYGKKRLVATIRASKELEPGGYYAYLDFIQSLPEDETEVYSIFFEILSGKEELEPEAEIISLYYDTQIDELIFSIEVENTGNKHIFPEGQLILKDKEGCQVQTLELSLQEGVGYILPASSELMLVIGESIPVGRYLAEIIISEAGREIIQKQYELNIE